MIEIILPIRKEFSDKIFSGEKKFEFRKNVPINPVSKIYVYESRGAGAIVGEFTVDSVITGCPEDLWDATKHASGINLDSYLAYFHGKSKAFAYPIKTFVRYERPKRLSEFGLSAAPQNFVKVDRRQK